MKKLLNLSVLFAISHIMIASDATAAMCTGMNIACLTPAQEDPCCASSLAECLSECGDGVVPISYPLSCSESIWTDVSGENYQRVCNKTLGQCNYRCRPNYYVSRPTLVGRPPDCAPCPSSGSSSVDAQSIESCYIPAGVQLTNSTGTYSFSSDCFYTK